MKKKILLTLITLCLMTGCGKVPKLANGEEAIVSFDNSELSISATDVYEKLKEKYVLNVLIEMIDWKILLDKYPGKEDDALKYVADELKAVKAYYVDDKGKYDESALITDLTKVYGYTTVAEFENMLHITYYRNKAVEDYAKKQISDSQIKDYYKSDIFGDIECSHILIIPETTDKMSDDEVKAAEEAALKKAKDIIKELDGGATFAELAKKYSDDESSADKGGTLGYFNKGKMDTSFETAAYKLKLNTYSKEPVKSTYGYHIILKTGEKDKPELDDVKEQIITTLGKSLQSSDATLSINALVDLRKEYGINIEDSEAESQYTRFISNQLLNAQSSNQE